MQEKKLGVSSSYSVVGQGTVSFTFNVRPVHDKRLQSIGGQELSSVPSTCCICHFLLLAENCLSYIQLDRIGGYSISFVHSWKLECLDSSCSSTSAFLLDDVLVGPTRLARKASQFTLLLLGIQLWWIAGLLWCWLQGIEPIEEVLGIYYKMLKRLWEPGFCV